MSNFEPQNKLEELMATDKRVAEIYRAVERFLNNFGKENALYPTRTYVQVESEELKKLAQVFYRHLDNRLG